MPLVLESYEAQHRRWPQSGRHILAQYDEKTIVVYQAYRAETALYAAKNGKFGDGFSMGRMSWIKPNFLWMMYRSGWGTKEGQQAVLAIRIKRIGFDDILTQAVHSSFNPEVYGSETRWKEALKRSSVRLQWDPDHDPHGRPQARRAIQLGLEGEALRRYVEEWTVSIEDVSPLVAEQFRRLESGGLGELQTPREAAYLVTDLNVSRRLGIGG